MHRFRPSSIAPLVAALTLAAAASAADAQRATRPVPATRPAPAAPATADTLITIRGTVYDSVAGAPLAGATVQMAEAGANGRLWVATTDADGGFRIDSLHAGVYFAAFVHPSLDVLGIESPVVPVRVQRGMGAVPLAVPGPARLFGALCPKTTPYDSVAALVGRVHDADEDVGLASKIVATWDELALGAGGFRKQHRRLPAQSRPDGGYLLCGLPSNVSIQVGAEAPGRTSGVIDVTLPLGRVVRRDFALADSSAAVVVALPVTGGTPGQTGTRVLRGSARVAGVVRTKDGKPLSGARVSVEGTGVTMTTGDDGAFALGSLPGGTYNLVARAVGYEPRAVPVDLSSRRAATANVVLDTRVQTLTSVQVVGKRTRRSRDLEEFDRRRERGGFGHFVTAEDIDRTHPVTLTSALAMTPGIHLTPRGGMGSAIRGRGNCTPTVVIDGMAVSGAADDIDDMVHPNDVAGIEVYPDGAAAPAEYGGNSCGAVLIWTKR